MILGPQAPNNFLLARFAGGVDVRKPDIHTKVEVLRMVGEGFAHQEDQKLAPFSLTPQKLFPILGAKGEDYGNSDGDICFILRRRGHRLLASLRSIP